ncbi:MAG: BatD family protein [Bacteroidales bacterium]|nr:BatD family protein [Bacteroidales bacterium]
MIISNKTFAACCAISLMAGMTTSCRDKINLPEQTDDPYHVSSSGEESQPESKHGLAFEVKVPSQAEEGEPFYVEYVLKDADSDDFTPPEFPDGLTVVGGPSVSRSSSVQIINGHASSNSTCSYVYVVQADKEGAFEIPAATVRVEGKEYKSNKATVKVGSGSASSSAKSDDDHGKVGKSNSAQAGGEKSEPQKGDAAVSKGNLYFTIDATKRKVYEQEPIVLTYKVHSNVKLGLANVMLKQKPDLKGFWSQEIPLSRNITSEPERHGNELFGVGTCLKYVVFPQQTGKLVVPGVTFECDVKQRMSSMDPFDAFFSGGGNMNRVVQRSTDDMSIEVLPLPEKPAGFSGGVGQFGIQTALMTPEPKTNDVVTMRLTVNGVGNMGLIKAPQIKFPASFETYDAKMTDKTKVSEKGITGEVYFDYTFVPREVGQFDIPAAKFIYFDTERHEYVTLNTGAYHLDVKKGLRSQEDVDAELAMRNSDINDIHYGEPAAIATDALTAGPGWIGSLQYFGLLAALVGAFSALTVWLRRRFERNADVAGTRNRTARKKANKHLRACEKALATGDHNAFYSALSQALRGYFADKLTRDAAALTNDTILAALAERGLSDELQAKTKALLEDCDFARFAPSHDAGQREKDLARASELLNSIDQNIK